MTWGITGGQLGWGGLVEEGWRKGPWTAEEDRLLMEYVRVHGEGRWNSVARLAGLKRNGKSCRLRWVNYLRPDLKRGQITPHEESIILELHSRWGNRWSTIARSLPGRTDNEIKNYWRTHFKKKARTFPNSTSDKARTRLLKRQQFHHHQQQQQQQQQQQVHQQQHHNHHHHQQQLLQLNQLDMKKIMSLLDETTTENNVNGGNYYYKSPYVPQSRQEIVCNPYDQNAELEAEDQQHGCSYNYNMFDGNNGSAVANAASNEDNFLWDGLWNLDDIHANFGVAYVQQAKLACSV